MANIQVADTQLQAIAVKTNNALTEVMTRSTSWAQFMSHLPKLQQKQIPNDVYSYVNAHADVVADLDPNEFMARVVDCYSQGYTLTDGDAFILPFWSSKEKRKIATLVPGYMGIKRRAMETGMFKYFTVSRICKESIDGYDYRRGVPIFNKTYTPKGTEKVIGYLGYYEMFSGAVQEIYCSIESLEAHALKYSAQSKKAEKLVGLWADSFDAMCLKTMYRKLGKLAPKTKNPTQQQAQFYESLEDDEEPQAERPPYIDVDGVVINDTDEPLPFDDYEPEPPQEYEQSQSNSELQCANCGAKISDKVYNYSSVKFGKPLCFMCQKDCK